MDERRYYGLDALRGIMMMLGIVLHSAVFYLVLPPPLMSPMVDRGSTSYVCDAVVNLIHSFRMPTFFILSGFFTALLVEKRGTWGTYRNRAARILAPLLVGAVTILPLTLLFLIDYLVALRFGTHELLPDRAQVHQLGQEMARAGLPVGEPGLAHLWFLYYLCWFYLLIPVCRWLSRASERVTPALRSLLDSPVSLVVLGAYTAATLWPFQGAQVYDNFVLLRPHPPSLLYYGSFFVFGFVLHAHRQSLASYVRFLPWSIPLAAVLFPLSLYCTALLNSGTDSATAIHVAAVLAHGLCTWALAYVAIGLVLRFFDHESPWTLYISQSSYWVFLVHMPAACFAAWLLAGHDLPGFAKFTSVVAFTTVVSFVTYHHLVQRTWVSRFLNGKRFDLDWPWRKAPAVPPGEASTPIR